MIIIALGANLSSHFGTPYQTLEAAKTALRDAGLIIEREARYWLTQPVPVSDQPWFHNTVVSVKTDLGPYELLSKLHDIENEFGRIRSVRNAPRIIDLDLIAYDEQILNKPELIVPHPRMHKRAFVLLPLKEITEQWEHPVLGVNLDQMIANLPEDQLAQPLKLCEGQDADSNEQSTAAV